jgi:hypothetical protein
LEDKYYELVAPEIGDDGAKRLLDGIWAIETLDNIQNLPFGKPA